MRECLEKILNMPGNRQKNRYDVYEHETEETRTLNRIVPHSVQQYRRTFNPPSPTFMKPIFAASTFVTVMFHS